MARTLLYCNKADALQGRQRSYAKFYTADVKGNTAQFKARALLKLFR